MTENKVFIIAELSANHNGNLDLAKKTVDAIADAGADAVKIQTYKPESLTLNVDNEYFGPRKDGLWKGFRPWDLYVEGSFPYEWHLELKEYAESQGLIFFSTPFDKEGVDLLESLNIPIYKVASLEITDIPLIEYIASKKKPMIISTGVAKLSDIELVVEACRGSGCNDITLLKCTSEYPAPIESANLKTIPNLKETFKVNVGVSDHTMGTTVPIVAVALGAKVIEKHIILSRNLGGPDAEFSMEPDEFKLMVNQIRQAELSLGTVNYDVSEKNILRRRSIFVSQNIKVGDIISLENIKSVRPGYGMHPKHLSEVLGKRAKVELSKGTPLKNDYLE